MDKQSWQVTNDEAGLRLDKWLADETRLGSRSRAFESIARGRVFLNETEMTTNDAARRVSAGETIRLWMNRPGSAKRRIVTSKREADFIIVYEDDALIVINKPAGLLTVPKDADKGEPTLDAKLEKYLRPKGKRKPLIVHRIDRNTSGLVLFAKNQKAQQSLKDQFLNRAPERIYLAVIHGHPQPDKGRWRDFVLWEDEDIFPKVTTAANRAAKELTSHYRVLEKFAGASLVEVKLETGRRNQIRIQAALRGHQLVGEQKYLSVKPPQPRLEFSRQALHAARLVFQHPTENRLVKLEAPLPEDMQTLLDKLRLKR